MVALRIVWIISILKSIEAIKDVLLTFHGGSGRDIREALKEGRAMKGETGRERLECLFVATACSNLCGRLLGPLFTSAK